MLHQQPQPFLQWIESDEYLFTLVVVSYYGRAYDYRVQRCEPLLAIHDYQLRRFLFPCYADSTIIDRAVFQNSK